MKSHPTTRNASIELFRIMLMFLIVLHHAAYHGHWNHTQSLDATHPSIYLLFTALTIWHVDGFLAITGWFGTRFTITRFSRILGLIALYTVPSILFCTYGNPPPGSGRFAGGWFGHTYLVFLFVAPMLNAAIDFLANTSRKMALTALIVFDVGMTGHWIAYSLLGIGGPTAGNGASLLTFAIVYLNVRLIRTLKLYEHWGKRAILSAGFLFLFGLLASGTILMVCRVFALHQPWIWSDWIMRFGWASGYNAPQVIVMAIAGLLYFAQFVTVPQCLAKAITTISPLMFGVYVLHETTSFGRLIYRIPQAWLSSHTTLHPLLIILATAIACFVICVCVEWLRHTITAPFNKYFLCKLTKLDERIGLTSRH